MQQGIFLPGFESGSIKYSEVLWFFIFFRDRQLRSLPKSKLKKRISFFYYLYIFFLFISVFNAYTLFEGMFTFRSLIIPQILTFTIAITGFEKEEDYVQFFRYLTSLIGIMLVYHLCLLFADTIILDSPAVTSEFFLRKLRERRYGSLFINSNMLGLFIVILLPVYIMLLSSKIKQKTLIFLAIPVLIFLLSQTRSRGAMISCGASLGILMFFQAKRIMKMMPFIIALALLFSIVMPGILSQLTRRFQTEGIQYEIVTTEDANPGRAWIWGFTVKMIYDYPLGIGLSRTNFLQISANPKYVGDIDLDSRRTLHMDNPHNSYLEMTIKSGVQALMSFLPILALFFLSSYRIIWTDSNPMLIGIVFGIFGYSIGMISEPSMFRPMVACVFWVVLCFGITLLENRDGALSLPDKGIGQDE